MSAVDQAGREIAVIIEQYRGETVAWLPGLSPEWEASAATPHKAFSMLLKRVKLRWPVVADARSPLAVSLLRVDPAIDRFYPPSTVTRAPKGAMVLFGGLIVPVAELPDDAIWLKPGASIPDDATDDQIFVLPSLDEAGNGDATVVTGTANESVRVLGGADSVQISHPQGFFVSKVYHWSGFRNERSNSDASAAYLRRDKIAVAIEQYRKGSVAYLPGLGPDWRFEGPDPTAAFTQLLHQVRELRPVIPTPASPVAVSLVTVDPDIEDWAPPATVVQAPEGVMVCFFGCIVRQEPPPPDAVWLRPGEPIPQDAPAGSVFVVPYDQNRTRRLSSDTVVIRATPYQPQAILNHQGGVLTGHPQGYSIIRVG